MTRIVLAILSILLFTAMPVCSQNLQALKRRHEKTIEEINYTNKLLSETDKNTKTTLNKLEVLNQQIQLRNRLLNDYNAQLSILNASIEDNRFVVECLSEDLENIRNNYSNLIRQAYRNRDGYNQLIFILSSENFNQAYKRILYTKQISNSRKQQLELIEAIKDIQQKKIADLEKRKKEQEDLLRKQKVEYSKLNSEKKQQSSYHKELQNKERELKKQLEKQRKAEESLQKEIEKIIAEEAKKAAQSGSSKVDRTLSDNFEKNKGKFPWPTTRGVITDHFGEHPHPVMKSVIIRNNGIDITTTAGEKALSIFKGTVSKVFAVPGSSLAVIVRHGQYISVYSNLKEVYVKQGDEVSTSQNIGLIQINDSGNAVLKFQIWKENTKLNPEVWISNNK